MKTKLILIAIATLISAPFIFAQEKTEEVIQTRGAIVCENKNCPAEKQLDQIRKRMRGQNKNATMATRLHTQHFRAEARGPKNGEGRKNRKGPKSES